MSSYGFPKQAEDAAASSGSDGCPMLGHRQDGNDTALTSADGDWGNISVNKFGNVKVQVEPSAKQTFIASSAIFTPAASATDVWTFTGSGTKTCKILMILLNYKSGSITSTNDFFLVKRSTANSGGTSSSVTSVPLDSGNSSATCSIKTYTANPTLGSLVGQLHCMSTIGTSTAGQACGNNSSNTLLVLYDHRITGQPLTVRGTGEVIALNNNGATVANSGTLSVTVIYTEE